MTKTTKTLLFGIPVLIGAYLIFKQVKKPKPGPTPPPPPPPPPPAPTGECSNYKVTTAVSNLNVRSTPSTSAAIVGSLPKDSIISVKASSTTGWMQLCDNSGYVSSLYLTKSASFSGGAQTGKRKIKNASGLKGLKLKFSGGAQTGKRKIKNASGLKGLKFFSGGVESERTMNVSGSTSRLITKKCKNGIYASYPSANSTVFYECDPKTGEIGQQTGSSLGHVIL